jgi:methylmalonyl-CoA mutase N-terminal domain/subunit
MQILQEETGICDTVDPLAGSYAVETLTNEMEGRIVEAMKEVEDRGGIVKAISDGAIQAHVSRQAYDREKAIRSGAIRKVGVNCHRIEEEDHPVELHPFRAEEAARAIERVRQVRRERDSAAAERAVGAVRAAAAEGRNVMPAVMAAVAAYATVGEIMGGLRKEFGVFREPVRF